MSPLRDVATSVTDSVNTAVDSSIREAIRAVDELIFAPINAAKVYNQEAIRIVQSAQ